MREDNLIKFIHTADIHLESPMDTGFPTDLSRRRRSELLDAYSRIIQYGAEENCAAVIIAGDLFDRDSIPLRIVNYVLDAVSAHPDMDVIYIPGNHDRNALGSLHLPSNLKYISGGWEYFRYDKAVVAASRMPAHISELVLDESDMNIVALHGAINGSGSERINMNDFSRRNIDYLALGHYHKYSTGRIDSRGIWCYSGCPEGRGFDETGEKGVSKILCLNATVKNEFIPLARRKIYSIDIDISKIDRFADLDAAVLKAVEGMSSDDILRLILTGNPSLNCPVDPLHLELVLGKLTFFSVVQDHTHPLVVSEQSDISLRGEFIRKVLEDDSLDASLRDRVMELGLRALAGEKLDL